jgi:hypothetical protein
MPRDRKSRALRRRKCLGCHRFPALPSRLFCEHCASGTRPLPEVSSTVRSIRPVSGGLPSLGKRR